MAAPPGQAGADGAQPIVTGLRVTTGAWPAAVEVRTSVALKDLSRLSLAFALGASRTTTAPPAGPAEPLPEPAAAPPFLTASPSLLAVFLSTVSLALTVDATGATSVSFSPDLATAAAVCFVIVTRSIFAVGVAGAAG